MPKYVFTNQENIAPPVPEGDYVLEVVSFATGVTKAGDEKVELMVATEGKNSRTLETLTFNEAAFWKIDTFVKSVGIEAKVGQELDITGESVIGRKGWAHLTLSSYKSKKDPAKDVPCNKVAYWYTDRGRVARNMQRLNDWIAAQANSHEPAQESAPSTPSTSTEEEQCPF